MGGEYFEHVAQPDMDLSFTTGEPVAPDLNGADLQSPDFAVYSHPELVQVVQALIEEKGQTV